VIRYADDFVVFHPTLEGIEAAKDKIATWLAGMGLELKPSKTRITHTLRCHDGNVGFDFLGFTIRQFPAGKCHTGTNAQGKPLGFKTCITPSKEATKRHVAEIGRVVAATPERSPEGTHRRAQPQNPGVGELLPNGRRERDVRQMRQPPLSRAPSLGLPTPSPKAPDLDRPPLLASECHEQVALRHGGRSGAPAPWPDRHPTPRESPRERLAV